MYEPRINLPNTPERRRPLVDCYMCNVKSDPHTGVYVGPRFRCASCHRKVFARLHPSRR